MIIKQQTQIGIKKEEKVIHEVAENKQIPNQNPRLKNGITTLIRSIPTSKNTKLHRNHKIQMNINNKELHLNEAIMKH